MTFISLPALELRRAEGTSPKGGAAPDFSGITGSLQLSACQKLDALLSLQSDHPLDDFVTRAVQEIAGLHPRATLLSAAEYVHARERGVEPRLSARSAYETVTAGIL